MEYLPVQGQMSNQFIPNSLPCVTVNFVAMELALHIQGSFHK
jgi:hypothetical protein